MNVNKVLDKKLIKKSDWKKFIIWSKKEQYLFRDINFFTKIYSIFSEEFIEENIVDFFIFNKFVLDNKYKLDWPLYLIDNKGNDIYDWIFNLLKNINKDNVDIFKLLINFLKKIRDYKLSSEKNWEKEYKFVVNYWIFIEKIRSRKIINYNSLIMHINKNVHKKMRGYK